MNTSEIQIQDQLKEVKNTLFVLDGIHGNLAHERELLSTLTSQISTSSKQIQHYSEKLGEQIEQSKHQIEETISREIRRVAKGISDEVSRTFVESITSQAETAAKNLQQRINQCENTLSSSSGHISFFSKWFLSVSVGSALIGGLLAGAMIHYLPPKLDQRTQEKISFGELLEAAWPTLTQKEKDKILEMHKSRGAGRK